MDGLLSRFKVQGVCVCVCVRVCVRAFVCVRVVFADALFLLQCLLICS